MAKLPSWRWWLSVLLAHALAVNVIWIHQFMTIRSAGTVGPTWERFVNWLSSSEGQPWSEVLNQTQTLTLMWLTAAAILLTILLIASIGRPGYQGAKNALRQSFQLRLRTIMIVIALIPFEWYASEWAWQARQRWIEYPRDIEWLEEQAITYTEAAKDPSLSPDVAASYRKTASDRKAAAIRYRYAKWRLWLTPWW